MQLSPFCMCCAINKEEKKLRNYSDPVKKAEYMRKILALFASAGPDDCAPSLAVDIKKISDRYWKEKDHFAEIKHHFNQLMMGIEKQLEEKIRQASDPLMAALIYARIGNYIDFSALAHVDQNQILSMIEEENQVPLDGAEYRHFLHDLSSASSLLYLADNCGEIVMDKIAVKILKEQYPSLDITVIVRGMPVANDVTIQDAEEVGLTSLAKVIGNGSDVGGTWLPGISRETRDLLEHADVILAKGQGNFETLNGCGWNVYYLFLCKCEWFQKMFHAEPLQGMFVNENRVRTDEQ